VSGTGPTTRREHAIHRVARRTWVCADGRTLCPRPFARAFFKARRTSTPAAEATSSISDASRRQLALRASGKTRPALVAGGKNRQPSAYNLQLVLIYSPSIEGRGSIQTIEQKDPENQGGQVPTRSRLTAIRLGRCLLSGCGSR
jgi:hypothetical protein